jgi:hypothetical protein
MWRGLEMNTIEAAEERGSVHYRKVVTPKPEILPACKNCKHFIYDGDDRMSLRGKLTFRKIRLRCTNLGVTVQNNCTCDKHEFAYADRRDR